MKKRILFTLILFVVSVAAFAQAVGKVSGTVKSKKGKLLSGVEIYVEPGNLALKTDSLGFFSINLPGNVSYSISFVHPDFLSAGKLVLIKPGEHQKLEIKMESSVTTTDQVVIDNQHKDKSDATGVKIKTKSLDKTIDASGDGLAIVKSMASVTSNNELSSAYSVRGGNFDENLIYVNGIQIYRPFLVRSGRQEGLSFVNSDMISDITFSAGGFDAKYGDKLSSVLDIQYKEPDSLAGGVNLSLLGARVHLEDKRGRLSYILGGRYKSNAYLLGALDTDGEFRPVFYDAQTYVNYDVDSAGKFKIGFLGNASLNKFEMIPVSRTTRFGGINNAFQLSVAMDGKEVSRFESYFGALTFDFKPTDSLKLKLTGSAFRTYEEETFDIFGAYRLNELETNLGESDFGSVSFLLGEGGFLNHSRNYLDATIYNIEHTGAAFWKYGKLLWGARYQHELIEDELLEWEMQDSADYSVPTVPNDKIVFPVYENSANTLSSNRYSGFLQQNWRLLNDTNPNELYINTGVRVNHWDYNNQTVFSPRASLVFSPDKIERDSAGNELRDSTRLTYRLAWGYYYQPPFYKELRNLTGELVDGLRAQRSIHYVAGVDYDFYLYKRPFTWRTEAYFKDMSSLIPFNVENVRIRYYGENSAKGYAYGLESRINGEFVKGLESWMSISYMKTEEDINNDYYYEYYNASGERIVSGFTADTKVADSVQFTRGWMPRATDQRVSMKIFFQDEMPKIPALKMHLNMVYTTGVPFGPPGSVKNRNTQRMPDYRRVDIGFSYQVIEEGKLRRGKKLVEVPPRHMLRYFKDFYIRMEVFNLLNISNTISHLWVSDIYSRQYAVPNFLTQRLINVRLAAKF